MKAAGIFSIASMAVTVMAAPLLGDVVKIPTDILSQSDAEGLVSKLPVGDALNEVVSKLPIVGSSEDEDAVNTSDVGSVDDIVTLLSGGVDNVRGKTGSIDDILAQFEAGDIDQSEADSQVISLVEGIQIDITEIVTSLTGAAGIPVADGDVDRVLVLVQTLLDLLLTNVNAIVTVLGLRPQLVSLLHSVFTLVANVLTLLIGLLAGLLPGLIAGLSPLLAGLGNGVLAPILTPVVALVAGLAGV